MYPKTDEEIIKAAQKIADNTPTSGARILAIPIYLEPSLSARKTMTLVHFKVEREKWVFDRME